MRSLKNNSIDLNIEHVFIGGASAQFRFQDEEGWDSAADSSEAMASVLSVNLEDLHQSLACIPLHKRLGIEEDLFSVSSIILKMLVSYLKAG